MARRKREVMKPTERVELDAARVSREMSGIPRNIGTKRFLVSDSKYEREMSKSDLREEGTGKNWKDRLIYDKKGGIVLQGGGRYLYRPTRNEAIENVFNKQQETDYRAKKRQGELKNKRK